MKTNHKYQKHDAPYCLDAHQFPDGGLKLDNHTKWNTRDLRKLIIATCKKENESSNRIVIITTSRFIPHYDLRPNYHGKAIYHRNWVHMFVPVPNRGPFHVQHFVRILTHEIGHNQGLHHRNMVDLWGIDVSWSSTFSVMPKGEK